MFTGPESEMDLCGWYSFYIYVTAHNTVSDIHFVVCNTQSDDDGQEYIIPLTDDEKKQVFKTLNNLSSMKLGYTCNAMYDLLQERIV